MPLFISIFGHEPDVHTLESLRDVGGLTNLIASEKKNRTIKIKAAEALGKIGDARAVNSLLSVLEHDDDDVRMFAAIALGKIGDPRAVEPLIAMLGDRHHEVRGSAASALGQLRDHRAVNPLHELSADPFDEVRKAAAEALDNILEVCDSKPEKFCNLKI